MQYIVFAEKNYKENETFVFYLQYTGNEKKLEKFAKFLKKANYNFMDGDYSTFSMQISAQISQQSVNEHLRINLGSYDRMFQVCKGIFTFDLDTLENLSDIEIANTLDELFYLCRICHYFKK
jgi:hypothetical protein